MSIERVTRRDFLKLIGLAVGAGLMSSCKRYFDLDSNHTQRLSPATNTLEPFTSTPTVDASSTPQPTEVPTTQPTEVSLMLTNEEFSAKSDDELKQLAPNPNLEQLGFPGDTILIPDTIIRGGEGANYILYRNPVSTNVELAWNAETGTQEHAIYSAFEKNIGSEVYKGIPCLFLTDSTVLQESGGGGWFGLDPQFPDAESRVGNAFNTALGFFYWAHIIRPGDSTVFAPAAGRSYDIERLPDFLDIPGYNNLRGELIRYWNNDRRFNEAPGPLRDIVAAYIRDKFLIDLNQKIREKTPLELTFNAKKAVSVDLTEQKLFIIKFVFSGQHRTPGAVIFNERRNARLGTTLKFVTQEHNNPVTFYVDDVRYNTCNYLYGGRLTGFLRYFFGDYLYDFMGYVPGFVPTHDNTISSDYTTGIASILCPPEIQPNEIRQYYELLGLPVTTHRYSVFTPYPRQQSVAQFTIKE